MCSVYFTYDYFNQKSFISIMQLNVLYAKLIDVYQNFSSKAFVIRATLMLAYGEFILLCMDIVFVHSLWE